MIALWSKVVLDEILSKVVYGKQAYLPLITDMHIVFKLFSADATHSGDNSSIRRYGFPPRDFDY
jgi:hypothetical protein